MTEHARGKRLYQCPGCWSTGVFPSDKDWECDCGEMLTCVDLREAATPPTPDAGLTAEPDDNPDYDLAAPTTTGLDLHRLGAAITWADDNAKPDGVDGNWWLRAIAAEYARLSVLPTSVGNGG